VRTVLDVVLARVLLACLFSAACTGPQGCGSRARRLEAVASPAQPQDAGAAKRARGRSAGCGHGAAGSGAFERNEARLASNTRTYHVHVPASYRAERAYPLVFRWHGWGGTGLSEGLDIEAAAGDDAIIAAPDGRNKGWSFQSGPEDLALFDAMYEALTRAYCIDLGRVFSYGFSAGGSVTLALGALRAERLRGVAVIAAFDVPLPAGAPIAAWLLYDRDDEAVPFRHGEAIRDRMRKRNHCSSGMASTGDGCIRYLHCAEGFPVVWCETQGLGHNIAGETAPAQVWRFFSQLR
jgi:polyhydroxybutyrate depolymerase